MFMPTHLLDGHQDMHDGRQRTKTHKEDSASNGSGIHGGRSTRYGVVRRMLGIYVFLTELTFKMLFSHSLQYHID